MSGGVEFQDTLTQSELAEWRRTRNTAPAPWRIETRGNPLTGDDRLEDGDAVVALPPRPAGILDAREATHQYLGMILNWAKKHPEFMLERARILKATSPLQFSHMSDEELAGSLLATIAEEKAKAAVEHAYKANGWVKPLTVEWEASGAPRPTQAVLLPGQEGRKADGQSE